MAGPFLAATKIAKIKVEGEKKKKKSPVVVVLASSCVTPDRSVYPPETSRELASRIGGTTSHTHHTHMTAVLK